jgi:hypothetical protein
VTISKNNVTGLGTTTAIAQNGIQVSRGASGGVKNNSVSGNQYIGTNNASSAGVLIYSGCLNALTVNIAVTNNTLTNNDVGVWFSNADPSCPPTQTKDSAVNNTITNGAVTNVSGDTYPCGYQAGISDFGNHDSLQNNKISGDGYTHTPSTCALSGTADVFTIDNTGSGTKVHKNSP